jgi:ABC-type branched-subunit amino acid transport system ATPase component
MLLDEPASGLSRAERVALTDVLRQLDPAITLILIQHDMDVALRVAERVTMMHEGRVIVEGTPDETGSRDASSSASPRTRSRSSGSVTSRRAAGSSRRCPSTSTYG